MLLPVDPTSAVYVVAYVSNGRKHQAAWVVRIQKSHEYVLNKLNI